ncbi:hypothetical protein V1282_002417 [Nitrobacteraceae bacterium AZCC 2146]
MFIIKNPPSKQNAAKEFSRCLYFEQPVTISHHRVAFLALLQHNESHHAARTSQSFNAAAIAFHASNQLSGQMKFWSCRFNGVAFCEMKGDFIQRSALPRLSLGEELPAFLGMKRSALAAHAFHCMAAQKFLHRYLPIC